MDYYEHTAEKGDMGAQVALGRLYYHGSQGVEQNFVSRITTFEHLYACFCVPSRVRPYLLLPSSGTNTQSGSSTPFPLSF